MSIVIDDESKPNYGQIRLLDKQRQDLNDQNEYAKKNNNIAITLINKSSELNNFIMYLIIIISRIQFLYLNC